MIINFETNKVYLSLGLGEHIFHDVALHLVNALHADKIAFDMLTCTNTSKFIWARDYMPLQINKNKYVRFQYEPDYLRDAPDYKPDVVKICSKIGLNVIDSDIILDGGNVISCGDKVILTDKIFKENPKYSANCLIDNLSELLEAQLVIIPRDRYEPYGHSDGMVRYVGDGTVLLNNYYDFDKSLRKKLLAALSPHFQIVELNYCTYTSNSWSYINFLHVGSHIFIPIINEKLDGKAFDKIAEVYPNCQCHPIFQCEHIVKHGGALNCVSWNVYENIPEETYSKEDF